MFISWWFILSFIFGLVAIITPICLLSTNPTPTVGTFTTPMIIVGVFGSLSGICFLLGIGLSEPVKKGYRKFLRSLD